MWFTYRGKVVEYRAELHVPPLVAMNAIKGVLELKKSRDEAFRRFHRTGCPMTTQRGTSGRA